MKKTQDEIKKFAEAMLDDISTLIKREVDNIDLKKILMNIKIL
jgi:hypothetical protein